MIRNMNKEITIIGAGLVGSLLSIFLSKKGYSVNVFERRADMRKETVAAGRSINLALSDRGIKALEEAGVMEHILPLCIPMHGRFIHKPDSSTAYQPYGKKGQFINSVSRRELNANLMDIAESYGVHFFFHHKCNNIDWKEKIVEFDDQQDNKKVQVRAAVIFGSDGAYAASRLAHQFNTDRFQYQQSYIDFGYKELTIPALADGGFALDKNALHIWPRGNYMLIALPNIDGSFTCTLFFPFEGEPSFDSLRSKEAVSTFFKNTFTDVFHLMPTLENDFFTNPTASIVTIKCFPWVHEDAFALIGDAAHAIVPFFGQGMNCGFEDCSVLNELVGKYDGNWKDTLREYQQLRKPDADAIADLAINNFVEMRDKVGDEKFLLQKRIESVFSEKHPDKWIPAYTQVTFSPHIRYSEALASSRKQELIMHDVMLIDDINGKWNSEEVENFILKQLHV